MEEPEGLQAFFHLMPGMAAKLFKSFPVGIFFFFFFAFPAFPSASVAIFYSLLLIGIFLTGKCPYWEAP